MDTELVFLVVASALSINVELVQTFNDQSKHEANFRGVAIVYEVNVQTWVDANTCKFSLVEAKNVCGLKMFQQ